MASLPLLGLVAYAAVDRYNADRTRAETGAANRAELVAALIGESSQEAPPTNASLHHLLTLAPIPDGTALAVFVGEDVVARAGAARAGPPVTAKTARMLDQRQGTFYAKGSDGIERVWGLARVRGGSLTVAYGRPGESVYGPARSALERDLAIAAAATLVAVLVSFLLGGRVTAPIRRLAKRVGTGGTDELVAIEQGFDTLGAAVAESEVELARRAERLATLHAIDKGILDAETPEEIARAALGRLRALVRASRASIVLFDRERNLGKTLAVDTPAETRIGSGAEYELDTRLFPVDQLAAGNAAIHPDIAPFDGSSQVASALVADGIRSYTVLPLVADGELLGSVTLGFDQPGGPSDDSLAVAGEVADQLAIALHQGRLHAELEAVLDAVLDAIVVVDSERRVLAANKAATSILGWARSDLVGARLDDELLTGWDEARWQSFLADGSFDDVFTVERGTERHEVEARGRAEFLRGRHLLVLRDVTERRRLEAQLRQGQKMEAIGRFAGGVAHDFNNLMTAVSGFSAIARRKIGDGPGSAEIDQVDRAAERATRLTYQLLAFAREQIIEPVVLDLGEVATSLMPMLTRLIGEDIETVVVTDNAASILGDRGQLEQVIVNLAVNARDAMPSGGTLTIETRDETIDPRYAAVHAGVTPGRFVCLTVTDTGGGISPEVRQHLFEPFFTTKDQGQGTGLGLATVHGIVTQSGGHIGVYSEPALGTTFKLYFPATEVAAKVAVTQETRRPEALAGTETVLLCEDDELVRLYIEEILCEFGYRVLSAARPSEALDFAANRDNGIAVLVTDIVMPQMSGPELAELLLHKDPGLKVLFLSGYSAETIRQRGPLPVGSAFLEKPFDDISLLRMVRALLDRSPEREMFPSRY